MIKNIFGFFGSISTGLYYIGTIKTFFKSNKLSLNNFDAINYYKILFNYSASFFSYFYADFNYYSPMIFCNKYSIYFNLFLLLIYLLLELTIDIYDTLLNLLLIGIVSFTYDHYFKNIAVDDVVFGIYYSCSNLITLFCLLYENYFEFKNKIKSNFTFYSNIIYTFSAFSWLVYGILFSDIYMEISFGIETFFGVLLILKNIYYDKKYADYTGFSHANSENINDNQNMDGNTIEFEDNKSKKYENI